ncbi:hypothetical protein POM88_010114 [Heracleum sosnowskyi]|uniref:YDG domain-containing protein n=1 Tax=Heracleum sosnowskyi TaxID=360622 RepID=A0AAD8JAM4_9APIA|nr:hypothetical protein POM88_010114 [Heracleum sosnowskyi]
MEGGDNDCAEVASGKGVEVDKDKNVHVAEINSKNQGMICYKETRTNLPENRIVASSRDVEEKEILKGEVNDYVEVAGVKGAEVKKDKNEINLFQGRKENGFLICAPTKATLGRCKAHADGSNNLTVKPKRNSVSKMNFAKRVSVLDDNGKERDTLAVKESNDMSIVPSDRQETPIRREVKETSNLFRQVLQKLLLSKEKVSQYTYVQAAMQLKEQRKAELVNIGLHHPFAAGIDYMEVDGKKIAISIVASGRYANETEFTDVSIYSSGGNPANKDRELKDQTLERGELALKNIMDEETPVRVVRGYRSWKSFGAGDKKREKETTFTYEL